MESRPIAFGATVDGVMMRIPPRKLRGRSVHIVGGAPKPLDNLTRHDHTCAKGYQQDIRAE